MTVTCTPSRQSGDRITVVALFSCSRGSFSSAFSQIKVSFSLKMLKSLLFSYKQLQMINKSIFVNVMMQSHLSDTHGMIYRVQHFRADPCRSQKALKK